MVEYEEERDASILRMRRIGHCDWLQAPILMSCVLLSHIGVEGLHDYRSQSPHTFIMLLPRTRGAVHSE